MIFFEFLVDTYIDILKTAVVVLFTFPLICFVFNTFLKVYFVINAAFTNKLTIKEARIRYKNLISMAEQWCNDENVKLRVILFQYETNLRKINANSTLPGIILIKPVWIQKMLDEDSNWTLAFFQTIGHELAHKFNEPSPAKEKTEQARFTNWVRECRADFYGINFVLEHCKDVQRKKVLEAVGLKVQVYTEKGDNPDLKTHPYWWIRYKLLEKHETFDKAVIAELAEYAAFSNKNYIDEIAKAVIDTCND